MMVAATMLPLLGSPLYIDRTMFAISPTNRLKQLSCTKRASDDTNEHYFSRKSLQHWDKFYKRHQNKFFKDRHYLEKDWGNYFCDNADDAISANGKVVLEVGFGAGNTIFPLSAAYPKLFIHACDFSTEALTLVQENSNFDENRINVFICDVTNEELSEKISPSSVDVVTLIFMLSAVSPNKMPFVVQNLKKILKPNGHILVRDYAIGDSAQVKLENRNQMISSNFYFRGDGTCSFYFSEDYLSNLFVEAGFCIVDMNTYCWQVENRSRNMTFHRYNKNACSRKLNDFVHCLKLEFIDFTSYLIYKSELKLGMKESSFGMAYVLAEFLLKYYYNENLYLMLCKITHMLGVGYVPLSRFKTVDPDSLPQLGDFTSLC